MRYLILITLLIFFNKNSISQTLFDTSFYNVEFVSSNIQDLKNQKIQEIKKKSLLNLFERTLSAKNYKILTKNLTEDLINTLIKNIILNDEKIINNKYSSKIKINFDKKKIINHYRVNKIPYVEYYPTKILLIINEDDKINENFLSKNNNYYKFYNKFFSKNSLFQVPNLDINDRFILKNIDLRNQDIKKISNFLRKYNLNDVVIVFTNKIKNKIIYDIILYSDNKFIEKKLNYNGKEYKSFFKILENETLNIWKKLNHIQNSSINMISCNLKYFNLFELKQIRNNLENISPIESYNIKKISYKNIKYDIYYYGNIKILTNIFHINNLNFIYEDDFCSIRLK